MWVIILLAFLTRSWRERDPLKLTRPNISYNTVSRCWEPTPDASPSKGPTVPNFELNPSKQYCIVSSQLFFPVSSFEKLVSTLYKEHHETCKTLFKKSVERNNSYLPLIYIRSSESSEPCESLLFPRLRQLIKLNHIVWCWTKVKPKIAAVSIGIYIIREPK